MMSTLHEEEYDFVAPGCVAIAELVALFLEGLKERSVFTMALQDRSASGAQQDGECFGGRGHWRQVLSEQSTVNLDPSIHSDLQLCQEKVLFLTPFSDGKGMQLALTCAFLLPVYQLLSCLMPGESRSALSLFTKTLCLSRASKNLTTIHFPSGLGPTVLCLSFLVCQ